MKENPLATMATVDSGDAAMAVDGGTASASAPDVTGEPGPAAPESDHPEKRRRVEGEWCTDPCTTPVSKLQCPNQEVHTQSTSCTARNGAERLLSDSCLPHDSALQAARRLDFVQPTVESVVTAVFCCSEWAGCRAGSRGGTRGLH